MHHETSRAKSGSDQDHEVKTEEILKQVLAVLDLNGDGVVTKREFLEGVKRGGLPNFEGIEGLGHHYDTEGEVSVMHSPLYTREADDCDRTVVFLTVRMIAFIAIFVANWIDFDSYSHEELYHNTPETQTDESYTHPEDIEHFRNHVSSIREVISLAEILLCSLSQEEIEAAEDALVMKAQGLDPDGNPLPVDADGQQVFNAPSGKFSGQEEVKRAKKYAELSKEAEARGTYNTFKRPKDQADRLRVGVPWKYKGAWG